MSTPISEKINEKENTKTSPNENWRGFAYLSFFVFIFVLLIGIFGSNFIYMTSLKPEFLDLLLPSENINYFEKDILMKGGMGFADNIDINTVSDYNCHIINNNSLFKSFSILPSKEFPYTMKKKSSVLESFFQKTKNWFVDTIATSFMTSRYLLKTWLKLFSKKNDTLQMLLIAPLNFWFGSGIAFIVGLVSTLMALYTASGNVGFILGFIFLYNFSFMSTLAVIQSFLFSLTFLVLPLILDFKKVMSIFHCNISTLTTLFGLLTCITALFCFDITSASIYILTFAMISIISLFL
jgi:hypothetical protein